MNNSVLEVRNLFKTFKIKQKSPGLLGGFKSLFNPEYKQVNAVNGISFSVERGEMLAFIGPNGAGKSTAIKMLTGILFPTSGDISVLGYTPWKDRTTLAYQIGTVFGQKAQLWYHLPPIDTYHLLFRIYELDETRYKKRLAFLVDAFDIKDLLRTPVRKLSLGQRMRCELVGSLLHEPKILFLDEPTIGLDVIAKQQVRDMLKYLNEKENTTVFLTSHDAGDIESITKRSIIVNHGQIMFDDATSTLKKNFLTTKVVELVVEGDAEKFNFPGGRMLEKSKHNLKIEIDTSTSSIERLLSYSLENFRVSDISIVDTPLEEIIAALYKRGH